jgi:hypothetical protein
MLPRAAVAGDQICILLGFLCSFILRQNRDKTFDILGECYVFNAMDGQIVSPNEAHETFHIDYLDNGMPCRKRRYAFSFSAIEDAAHHFLAPAKVAEGLKMEDIPLKHWMQ